MMSCFPQLLRNFISCIEGMGIENVKKLEASYTVLLYFILYTIIYTHTELLNDIDNLVILSYYCLTLKSYLNICFRGSRQELYVPNIDHFKLFLWSEENTVSRKAFNAVSLGKRSTWPQNCAHVILIHSEDSPVWQLFSLMITIKIFERSGWTDTNNDSSKNTNFKSEINKVSIYKRCQFLENIVPINETSEQNSNGYCNVDFVFTLDQTIPTFIFDIKVIFSIKNLYLFLKCISLDLRSLSSLWFNVRSICYFCAITCTVTEVVSGIINANNKELQVCVW